LSGLRRVVESDADEDHVIDVEDASGVVGVANEGVEGDVPPNLANNVADEKPNVASNDAPNDAPTNDTE
jgi:hypothetical protein